VEDAPRPNNTVMLRLFAPATTRSGFLSLFTSPMTILPAPPGTVIGEPAAGANNAGCVSTLIAFPDWHELKTTDKTVISPTMIERQAIECFTTTSIQVLDGQQRRFLPVINS
jgi:hypothetical protein